MTGYPRRCSLQGPFLVLISGDVQGVLKMTLFLLALELKNEQGWYKIVKTRLGGV